MQATIHPHLIARIFSVILPMIVSVPSLKAQFNSLTVAPRLNLGYFFPVQTTTLWGENFMSSQNAGPLIFSNVVLQDGSVKPVLMQHGGYGLEFFYNAKKGLDEYNWSFGGSFFVQKHLYALDVPDFDFKGSRCDAIVDYYKYLAYKLCIRKYWTTVNDRQLFVQLSGIYSNRFRVSDNTWQKPEAITQADYTDNGNGYTVNNYGILKENFLVEAEFGSRFMDSDLCWSVALSVPLKQYIFKSDITYYENHVPIGAVQTRESQLALWVNLSYPLTVASWTKKPKTPKPVEVVPEIAATDRKRNIQHTYTTRSKTIIIEIFDNASADGDTASLDFNGTWLLEDYPVTKEPLQLTIELKEGENQISLYAKSLGITPPNTAAIAIIDGEERKTFVLNSDYSRSGTLRIYKE